MWLDVFKWPEMIKYKKERDDQFAGTEGMFDRNRIFLTIKMNWLHRCWWRMLETKCVGENFKMLVTILAILVTKILYLLT